jgi:hypothetical protein
MARQLQFERGYGVVHEGDIGNRVYIPRVKTAAHIPSYIGSAVKRGFQHEREIEELPLQEMERLNVEGNLKGDAKYLTDPIDLLEHRLLAGAHASGWSVFRHTMGDVLGAPAVVEDAAKSAENEVRVGMLRDAHSELQKLGEQIPQDHEAQVAEARRHEDEFMAGHVQRIREQLAEIDQQIADTERQLAEYRGPEGPPGAGADRRRAGPKAKCTSSRRPGVV